MIEWRKGENKKQAKLKKIKKLEFKEKEENDWK